MTLVSWTNLANNIKGTALGSNSWTAAGIPIVAGMSNRIIVTAATTSWASAYRGATTFNDTLTVIQSPVRLTLTLQWPEALLNWTGGSPPYRVQRATDLTVGDWTDYLLNAMPPVRLTLTNQAGYYRILGN